MKANWNTDDIPDLQGKLIIITGANSGLGFSSAKAIAAKGGHVILAVRNLEKGQAAVGKIKALSPQAELTLMSCDVSKLESVESFAEDYLKQFDHVDVVMNNAGIMMTPRWTTREGFEGQFASNHLGHFALTGKLMDALKASPNGGRVVNVSSLAATRGTMKFQDIHWEKNYHPFKVYAQSKLANQLFTYGMHRRLQTAGVSSVAALVAHPGGSNTNLLEASNYPSWLKKALLPIVMPMAQSADMGALPQLYAAVAEDAKPGRYYGPRKINEVRGYPKEAKIPPQALSTDAQDKLWEMSEEMTGVKYLS